MECRMRSQLFLPGRAFGLAPPIHAVYCCCSHQGSFLIIPRRAFSRHVGITFPPECLIEAPWCPKVRSSQYLRRHVCITGVFMQNTTSRKWYGSYRVHLRVSTGSRYCHCFRRILRAIKGVVGHAFADILVQGLRVILK